MDPQDSRGGAAPAADAAAITAVMSTMRAMRRLSPDPVPAELVEALIRAATWAPSAARGRGQRFIVVTDREVIARMAGLWRVVVDFYLEAAAPAGAGYGSDPHTAGMLEAIRYQRDHFAETPVVVVVCYDQREAERRIRGQRAAFLRALVRLGPRRAFRTLRDLRAFASRSEAASIYPAVENLLLAARANGLGANLTTWHLFAEAELKALLGIPPGVRTFAVVPIGWPLGRFGPVGAPALDEVVHRDRW
ncbi:MAG TPA: nitroreductase family protein [Candidatus Limnocylindrales bacterium]